MSLLYIIFHNGNTCTKLSCRVDGLECIIISDRDGVQLVEGMCYAIVAITSTVARTNVNVLVSLSRTANFSCVSLSVL